MRYILPGDFKTYLTKQVIKNKELGSNGICQLAKKFLEILESGDGKLEQQQACLDVPFSKLTLGDYESLLDIHEYNQGQNPSIRQYTPSYGDKRYANSGKNSKPLKRKMNNTKTDIKN